MDISQLLGALGAHRYLFAFVLLAAYTRRLTASDSQFPLSVPSAWRPVVTSFVGLGYGVLASVQAGASWRTASLGGLISAATGGFADMLLVAIFANPAKAPAWARALAFVFDDFKGDAAGGASGSAPPSASSNGVPPPQAPPAKMRTVAVLRARAVQWATRAPRSVRRVSWLGRGLAVESEVRS
jgi:hypothetical protein